MDSHFWNFVTPHLQHALKAHRKCNLKTFFLNEWEYAFEKFFVIVQVSYVPPPPHPFILLALQSIPFNQALCKHFAVDKSLQFLHLLLWKMCV